MKLKLKEVTVVGAYIHTNGYSTFNANKYDDLCTEQGMCVTVVPGRQSQGAVNIWGESVLTYVKTK